MQKEYSRCSSFKPSLNVRIIGTIEEIDKVVSVLKQHFTSVVVSGPYRNEREPGYRVYVNFEVEDESNINDRK